MATVNPYAAPKAAVEDVQSAAPEPATRWQRFAAAFVDGIILGGIGAAAALIAGRGAASGAKPGASFFIAIALGIAFVGAVNLWMLHRYRASIGKKALKIRMVRTDGSDAGLARLVFMRGLPQWIVSGLGNAVPLLTVLSFVDVLFIFGSARRCVHDYIADTIVVKAE